MPRQIPIRCRLSALTMVAVLCACATPKDTTNDFVTRDELETLLSNMSQTPSPPTVSPAVVVQTWQLAGPQPTLLGGKPVPPKTPLEEALENSPNTGSLNDAEVCVARESLRFMARHDSLPADSLGNYIEAWCGAPGMGRTFSWHQTESEQTMIRWGVGRLRAIGAAGRIGVWSDPESGKTMIAQSENRVDLDPVPLVADRPLVEFRGTVAPGHQERFESLWGLITSGPYDTESCNRDPNVEYPNFSIQCVVADAQARVDLSGCLVDSSEVGRSLGTFGVFREPPGLMYRSRPVPKMPLAPDPAQAMTVIVETINQLRTEAGRAPIVVAKDQSAVLRRAVPHLSAALSRDDFEVADPLIAGLRSGWEIKGSILSSSFAFRYISRLEPSEVVAQLWDDPSARSVIFAPEAQSLAAHIRWIGDDEATAEVFLISYEHLPDEHYNRRVGRVLRRIDQLRAAYDRKPAKRLVAINEDIKAIADEVSDQTITPEQGYKAIGNLGWKTSGARWWYNYRYARDLSEINISPQLLRRKDLTVNVSVAVARRGERPYARYVVYFFWLD